jgi:hypothetical protein
MLSSYRDDHDEDDEERFEFNFDPPSFLNGFFLKNSNMSLNISKIPLKSKKAPHIAPHLTQEFPTHTKKACLKNSPFNCAMATARKKVVVVEAAAHLKESNFHSLLNRD